MPPPSRRLVDELVDPIRLPRVEVTARRWGVPALEAAMTLGLVTPEAVVEALALRLGATVLRDEAAVTIAADPAAWQEMRRRGWVPIDRAVGGMAVLLAPDAAMTERLAAGTAPLTGMALPLVLATPAAFAARLRRWAEDLWVEQAVTGLAAAAPWHSAADRSLMRRTAGLLVAGLAFLFLALALGPEPLALVAGVMVGAGVVAWAGLRVWASAVRTMPLARHPLAERDLPRYTVLCPLYREAAVVPALLASLAALDYPRAKLSILLLVEADDPETLAALHLAPPDPAVEVLVLPPRGPRTKPKALMLGLAQSDGELVVVYDAEDRPGPGQLREAAEAFAAAGPHLGCLQAPLSIIDGKGLLSRFFAAEYEALFRVLLPALARQGWPLPLGGTSNHFRRAALEAVGGWDPYNVTEDADLGFRLAREGWTTGTITIPTREEAPATFAGWLGQRARWFKGWMQTMAVLLRRPHRLPGELGAGGCLVLAATLGGSLLSALVHLVAAVALGVTVTLNGWPTWAGAGAAIFAAGYGGSLVFLAAGLIRAGRSGLIPWLPLLPLVWLAMGLAALRALGELWSRPFHWEKTTHGEVPWPEDPEPMGPAMIAPDGELMHRVSQLSEAALSSGRHRPADVAEALSRHARRLRQAGASDGLVVRLEALARDLEGRR